MQPPPTPVSQYGYYREVQLATDLQAKVLVDQYGRLILHVENDVNNALVWNVESGIIDVNSEGRYNTRLAEWIANFGESQYSYLFNETNNYTIIADSDEEDIQFNDATGEWSPALRLYDATPVPVLGQVQVFKNAECTQYADGTETDIYVRINVNVATDEQLIFGSMQDEGSSCVIYGPTSNPPQNGEIWIWIDWKGEPQPNEIVAGSIIVAHNEQPYSEPKPEFTTIFGE